jgi:hypothetical protein
VLFPQKKTVPPNMFRLNNNNNNNNNNGVRTPRPMAATTIVALLILTTLLLLSSFAITPTTANHHQRKHKESQQTDVDASSSSVVVVEDPEPDEDDYFGDPQMLKEIQEIVEQYRQKKRFVEKSGDGTPHSPSVDKDTGKWRRPDSVERAPLSLLPIDKTVYHDQESVERILRELSEVKCPSIMRLHTAGKSHLGQEQWYVEVSDNPGANEPGEPELRFVGNLHGNEVVGRELALWIAEHLCDLYVGNDAGEAPSPSFVTPEFVRWLVDNTHIFIMPSANPDGFLLQQRYNVHHADLNRGFPDQFDRRGSSEKHHFQREIKNLMQWSKERSFMLSATFHGGDVVANYPWDGNREHRNGAYSAAPDDRHFKALALSYAAHNPEMMNNPRFKEGITNGAEWYVLYGGYQDWTYWARGDMQLTLELSHDKWPGYNAHATGGAALARHWDLNRDAAFNYMAMAHRGIKGFVHDARGAPVRNAIIRVHEYFIEAHKRLRHRLMDVHVDPDHGDYYRFLVPGTYDIEVVVPGREDKESEGALHHFDIRERAKLSEYNPTHRGHEHEYHFRDQAIVHNFTLPFTVESSSV